MQQIQQNSATVLLANLRDAGIGISVEGEKLRLKPTPGAELLDLVRRHKAEILVELTGRKEVQEPPAKAVAKRLTKAERQDWPQIVYWKMKTAAVYRDEKFARMASTAPAGKNERTSFIVLTTMPLRDERFRVPLGATHWQAGADILAGVWRGLNELPKHWR